MTIYFEWTKLSGSTPPVGPTVNSHAVDEPEAQNVFSFTVVPSLLKKASPDGQPLHQAFIAEIAVGHDRLAAVARDDVAPALPISAIASSQEMRSNWREPFGPTRRNG